jgi:DNA-binding CsgD family transcriptional regulator
METSASVVRANPEIWFKGPLGSGKSIARSARERPTSRGLALLAASIASRPEPILVIEANGRVVARNPAAVARLTCGPVMLRGDAIRLEPAGTILDQGWLVRAAGSCGENTDGDSPLHVELPTRSGTPRLFATAQRLESDEVAIGRHFWMITLHPAVGPRSPCARRLSRLLGLTPAESRLVAELFVQCGRLDDVAAARGITRETARSQLRSVFQKCALGSQAELVRLVAMGPFF